MTKLRHSAATLVSAVLGTECHDLAQLMMHTQKEQQKTYNDCIKAVKNVRVSNILQKILTETPVAEADLESADFGQWCNFHILTTFTFCDS